jgi:hypothetical protein
MRRLLAICALTVALSACESPATVDCTLVDPFPWAIIVDPVSGVSGLRVVESVTGTASDASEAHELVKLPSGRLAALVPNGTYDVTLRAEGFQDWTARGVSTRPAECGGFDAVELVAQLVPAP